MDQNYVENWAARIRTFISKDDFYQIQYYLDAWDIARRKACVDYKYLGSTALMKACELERYPIIRYLVVECNADVNLQSDANVTPLFVACSHGDLYMIEFLLNNGANINWTDTSMRTYLMLFIENGSLSRFLISKGIDISKRDLMYQTALDYALQKSALVSLEMLIKCGVDINAEPFTGEMPISVACKNSNLDLLEYLISNGGKVNRLDNEHRTYLMNHIDKYKVCELLIKKGIKVNATDFQWKSALHYAAEQHVSLETVSLLLTNDADIFAKDYSGKSALQAAVQNCSFEVTKYLLSAGADPNCRDRSGNSVLNYAIDTLDTKLLRLILDYGADANSADEIGQIALHYAVDKTAGENAIGLLLQYGAVINAQTCEDMTPLHYAVSKYNMPLIKFLLTNGSDPNCTDFEGLTPLHLAIKDDMCSYPMMKLLIKYGADLNTRDHDGIGVMQEAALMRKTSFIEHFIQHLDINKLSIIEAYELMATEYFRESSFEGGSDCLHTAIQWREANSLVVKPVTKINVLFNNVREPQSHQELQSLNVDMETVLTQAAIITARILGAENKTVFCILDQIVDEVEDLEELLILRIREHCLKTAVKVYRGDIEQIENAIADMTHTLFYTDSLQVTFKDVIPCISTIMHAFEKFVTWNDDPKSERTTSCYSLKKVSKHVLTTLYIFSTFANGDKDIQISRKYLRRYFEMCPEKRAIHLFFDGLQDRSLHLNPRRIETILEIAVSHGFPLSTLDLDGSMPLHLLLRRIIREGSSANAEDAYDVIVRQFLQNGTHICKTDGYGASLLELLQGINYPICKVKDRTLQCLAADVIMNENIQFEDIVPTHLYPFIRDHGCFKDDP